MVTLIKIDPTQLLGEKPPELPMPVNGWMAGGAVRRWFNNEPLSDVDFFFTDKSAVDVFILNLISFGFEEVDNNPNAISFMKGEIKVQVIRHKYYKDINELLDSFDFSVCQFVWDGKDVYSTPLALVSVLRGHLGSHKIEGNVMDSLRRAFKYARKGYWPCNGTLMALGNGFSGLTTQQIKDFTEISPNGGRRIIRID